MLRRLQAEKPDLCIVDLGLPDMDGIDLVRRITAQTSAGVLILTGRGHTADRVMGLELGGDDYMTKPFESRELVARVRSILRRRMALAARRRAAAPLCQLPGLAHRLRGQHPARARRQRAPAGHRRDAGAALLRRAPAPDPDARAADGRARPAAHRPQHRRAHLAPAPQDRASIRMTRRSSRRSTAPATCLRPTSPGNEAAQSDLDPHCIAM